MNDPILLGFVIVFFIILVYSLVITGLWASGYPATGCDHGFPIPKWPKKTSSVQSQPEIEKFTYINPDQEQVVTHAKIITDLSKNK